MSLFHTINSPVHSEGDECNVILYFYPLRCRFSQMLAPVFEQASDLVHEEFPVSIVFIVTSIDHLFHSLFDR